MNRGFETLNINEPLSRKEIQEGFKGAVGAVIVTQAFRGLQ